MEAVKKAITFIKNLLACEWNAMTDQRIVFEDGATIASLRLWPIIGQ
jgi:hypothetical protein